MADEQESLHLRKTAPTQEDEFFAREDRERIEALQEERRRKAEAEGQERLKQLHWMRCPKCGGELTEVVHEGILIDRCGSCQGIFLDAGELEALVGKGQGVMSNLMGWLRK